MWHWQHKSAYGLPFVGGGSVHAYSLPSLDSEGFDKRAERLKGMIGRELKRAGKGIPGKPEGDRDGDLTCRAETLFDQRANRIREMIAKEKKRLVSSHEDGGKHMGFEEVEAVRRDSAQSVDLQAIAAWLPQCTPTRGEAEAGHGHAEPGSRPRTQGLGFDLAKYKEEEIDPVIVLKAREELERIGIINKQTARGISEPPEPPHKQLPLSLSGCTPCPSCAKHLYLASVGFCPGCGLQQKQQRVPGASAQVAARPAAAGGWASAGPHAVSISTPSGTVKVSFEGETGAPSSSSPAVPRPMARAPSPGSQRPSGRAPPPGGGGGSRGPSPGPPGSGRGPSPAPPGSAGRPVRRTPSGAAPIAGQVRTPAGAAAAAAPVARVSATTGDATTPQARQGRPPAPGSAGKEEGTAPAAAEAGTAPPAPAAAVAAGEELVASDAGSGPSESAIQSGAAAQGGGEAVLADSLHAGGVVAAAKEGDAAVASDSAGDARAGLVVSGGDADQAVQEGVYR